MTSISDTEVVNAPGGLVELGYSQITSSVTIASTSFTTPTTIIPDVTVVCDGSPIMVEFYAPQTAISSGQSQIVFALWEDGAEKYRYWQLKVNPTGSTGTDYDGVKAEVRLTPSAGLHTYRVVGISSPANNAVITGSGTTSNSPAFLRVSKIIQASQLLVTQSNAPIVTSLPSGNLVTGQEVYLYTVYGYVRYLWDGSNWVITADNRKVIFTARGTSFQGAANGFYNFIFNTTDQNIGNAYNTANGAFTAPISGFYFFGLNARLDSTPSGGYLRAFVYRSGTTSWQAPNLHAIFGNNHATDYHTLSVSGLMYLTEGQVVYSGGGHISGSSNLLSSESTFTGYLVK